MEMSSSDTQLSNLPNFLLHPSSQLFKTKLSQQTDDNCLTQLGHSISFTIDRKTVAGKKRVKQEARVLLKSWLTETKNEMEIFIGSPWKMKKVAEEFTELVTTDFKMSMRPDL